MFFILPRLGKMCCVQSINQSNYYIVRLKVDQRAGQLSLPHLGITKTEKIELKHKNR